MLLNRRLIAFTQVLCESLKGCPQLEVPAALRA